MRLQAYSRTHSSSAVKLPPLKCATVGFPPPPPLAGFPTWLPGDGRAQREVSPHPSGTALSSLRFHLLAAPVVSAPADAAVVGAQPSGSSSGGSGQQEPEWDFWLAASRADARGVCQEVLHMAHCSPADLTLLRQQQRKQPQQQQQQRVSAEPPGQPCEQGPKANAAKRKRDADSGDEGDDPRPAKSAKGAAGTRPLLNGAAGPTANGHASSADPNGPLQQPCFAATNGGRRMDGSSPGTRTPAGGQGAETAAPGSVAAGSPSEPAAPDIGLPAALQWCHTRIVWLSLVLQLQVCAPCDHTGCAHESHHADCLLCAPLADGMLGDLVTDGLPFLPFSLICWSL